MQSSADSRSQSSHNLRQRNKQSKMGPQTEEHQIEVIEMVEQLRPVETKDEDWTNDSEEAEFEVMIKDAPKSVKDYGEENEESFWLITFQVFFPFLIAGLGMVGAGLVLDIVQASIILLLI